MVHSRWKRCPILNGILRIVIMLSVNLNLHLFTNSECVCFNFTFTDFVFVTAPECGILFQYAIFIESVTIVGQFQLSFHWHREFGFSDVICKIWKDNIRSDQITTEIITIFDSLKWNYYAQFCSSLFSKYIWRSQLNCSNAISQGK